MLLCIRWRINASSSSSLRCNSRNISGFHLKPTFAPPDLTVIYFLLYPQWLAFCECSIFLYHLTAIVSNDTTTETQLRWPRISNSTATSDSVYCKTSKFALKLLKSRSGGQEFGELVNTPRNTVNAGRFAQFVFHQSDMSKVSLPMPFFFRYDFGFHDLNALNLQNNLMVLRQLQYLQTFDIRHYLQNANTLCDVSSICKTRCLQHLQNVNHVRRANDATVALVCRRVHTGIMGAGVWEEWHHTAWSLFPRGLF